MTTTPIADAIRRIEDGIGDERYWCQGRFTEALPGGEAVCLSWAVAEESQSSCLPVGPFVREVLNAYHDESSIPRFNDRSTHEEVMLFLATCLDVAEAEAL